MQQVVTGAADSSGAAISNEGLRTAEILRLKRAKKGIAAYPHAGNRGMTPQELVRQCRPDILVELSLTDLKDGEPGLTTIREALSGKVHVATANKGPLVLAYRELAAL